MNLLKTTTLSVAVLMTLGWAATAHAALVGVDFGKLAEPQTTPTNWTFAATEGLGNPAVFSNLIDETGANSGWSVSIESIGGGTPDNRTVTFPAGDIPQHTNPLGGLDGNAGYVEEDADERIIWSGLSTGALYDFWVFSAYTGDVNQTVTVSGGSAPIVFGDHIFHHRLNVNGVAGSSANTLDSYAMQQTADGNGEITILVTPDSGTNAAVAGVALQLVPEPTTLSLLALGGLALLRRRRVG